MTKRIAIVCSERSLSSSVGIVADAFHLVNGYVQRRSLERESVPPPSEIVLVSDQGGAVPLAGNLLTVQTDAVRNAGRCDAIVLPAIAVDNSHGLDEILASFAGVTGWLKAQHSRSAYIAAIGPSVAALPEIGLARKQAVAVPWWLQSTLQQRYRTVEFSADKQVIQSDRIITCGNIALQFDVARRIMDAVFTPRDTRWLTRMVGHVGFEFAHRLEDGDEAEIADPLVARVKLCLEENFTRQVRMDEMAMEAGVCERTLARRFERLVGLSPHAYLQALRIDISKEMLIRTNRSVERISNLVGYSDTRFYRKLFREHTGVTPSDFRRTAQSHPYFGTADENETPYRRFS